MLLKRLVDLNNYLDIAYRLKVSCLNIYLDIVYRLKISWPK